MGENTRVADMGPTTKWTSLLSDIRCVTSALSLYYDIMNLLHLWVTSLCFPFLCCDVTVYTMTICVC